MYIGGDDKTSTKKYILFLSGITKSTSLPNNSHKSNSQDDKVLQSTGLFVNQAISISLFSSSKNSVA